jgi:hypothetical protein
VLDSLRLSIAAVAFDKVIMIFTVTALKKHHLAVVLISQCMGGDAIQKPAIMRYDEYTAGKGQYGFFQSTKCLNIEIVGWLV